MQSDIIGDNLDIFGLVEASGGGDRGAFDELVRLYQVRAMRVAIGILGDANEGCEAVQVGFVKAYLNIDKLKDVRNFEGWLLRIVANAAISQRRSGKRRSGQVTITDCLEDKKNVSPLESEIAGELKEAITQAMGKLSKKEAKAMGLFGLRGMTHKQAGRIMGCSAGTVRWHVYRARVKLKVLLKEYL
ncbi:RNA polymerase sigma factor [Planctomycetota bacterium]